MKSLFLFVFTCFMGYLACAQIPAPTFRWAVPISGALDITDMKVTPAGDTYITGYFEDYICFDTTWAHCQEGLGEGTDQYIAKYNRDGVLQWAKVVGSKNSEGIGGTKAFEVDDMGNVYYYSVAYSDTLWVGDAYFISQELIYFPSGSTAHGFLLNLSMNGDVIAVNQSINYGVSRFDFKGSSLYFAAGVNTQGTNNDTLHIGKSMLIAPDIEGLLLGVSDKDGYLIKYKILPKPGDFSIYTIETLTDGTILLHGSFKDSLTIGDTTFVAKSGGDFFLFAFNHKFQLKWAEVYDNGFGLNRLGLQPAEDGTFYLWGSVPWQAKEVWMGDTLDANTDYLYLFAKLTSDKKVLWRKTSLRNGFAMPLAHRNQFYFCMGIEGGIGDTVDWLGLPVILTEEHYEYCIRTDTLYQKVWDRYIFSYGDLVDRGLGLTFADSLGHLYGRGSMRQFVTYLDDLVIRPLFTAMNQDFFIVSTTEDSFFIPPAPDTIPPQWQIYPNPFTETITISGEWEIGVLSFSLCDMSGREIIQKDYEIASEGTQKLRLTIPNLSQGVYLAHLVQGRENKYIKIIKY